MTAALDDPSGRTEAERLFDEHLARLARGEEVDFEALCAAHPEQADDLRRLEGRGSAFHETDEGPVSLFRGRGERAAVVPGPWDVAEGRVLGDYRLVGPIGRGGMGEVWEAEQVSLSRRVALKLLLPERVDTRGVDFFAREARAGLEAAGARNPQARAGNLIEHFGEGVGAAQVDLVAVQPVGHAHDRFGTHGPIGSVKEVEGCAGVDHDARNPRRAREPLAPFTAEHDGLVSAAQPGFSEHAVGLNDRDACVVGGLQDGSAPGHRVVAEIVVADVDEVGGEAPQQARGRSL